MTEIFEVVGLSWERVRIHIDVDVVEPEIDGFFLDPSLEDPVDPMPIESTRLGAGRYRLSINVTCFNGRQAIPDGRWRIVARSGTSWLVGRYDLTRVRELDGLSRTFLFDQNRQAYCVTFGVRDSAESPDLLMRTYAYERRRVAQPVSPQRLIRAARDSWRWTKRAALRQTFRAALATRQADPRRILFASEARPSMQGNLKSVHDRMIERGLDHTYEFGYSFRTEHTSSRTTAFQLAWQMGRAHTILIDDYFAVLSDLGDRSKQRIIQLWHAGSGFKSIGYSRFGSYGSPRLENPHRHYTYAIAGSQHLRDVYAEAFGIEREAVIATGLPRIDDFLRDGRAAEIAPVFDAAFPAATGKRKILFAPTFRGRGAGDAHYDYDRIDFEALYRACGEHTVMLFRQHHFIRESAPIPSEYSDRLIDVAAFPDTNDLLLLSDVLVTDYSSIIYEYSLLGRPMVFYAYDLDTYAATRGMHRDYREVAPGPIATDFDEFLQLIADPSLSVDRTEAFVRENFDFIDTHNSDRVIDWLILGSPDERGEIPQS